MPAPPDACWPPLCEGANHNLNHADQPPHRSNGGNGIRSTDRGSSPSRPLRLRRTWRVVAAADLAAIRDARRAYVEACAIAARAHLVEVEDITADELAERVIEAAAELRKAEAELVWRWLG